VTLSGGFFERTVEPVEAAACGCDVLVRVRTPRVIDLREEAFDLRRAFADRRRLEVVSVSEVRRDRFGLAEPPALLGGDRLFAGRFEVGVQRRDEVGHVVGGHTGDTYRRTLTVVLVLDTTLPKSTTHSATT